MAVKRADLENRIDELVEGPDAWRIRAHLQLFEDDRFLSIELLLGEVAVPHLVGEQIQRLGEAIQRHDVPEVSCLPPGGSIRMRARTRCFLVDSGGGAVRRPQKMAMLEPVRAATGYLVL